MCRLHAAGVRHPHHRHRVRHHRVHLLPNQRRRLPLVTTLRYSSHPYLSVPMMLDYYMLDTDISDAYTLNAENRISSLLFLLLLLLLLLFLSFFL